MDFRKILLQVIYAMFTAAILFSNSVSHAEVKTYTDVGEHYMSDFETF